MSRKFLLILIVIIMLGSAGGAYWYFFIRTSTPTSTTTTDQTESKTFKSFLPFGIGSLLSPSTTDTEININTEIDSNGEVVTVPINKFTKITNFAVAGATFFEDMRPLPQVNTPTITAPVATTPTTTTPTKAITPTITSPVPQFKIVPSLRYVERATGHIFQKYLDTNKEGKISNSTIPAIYEAIFGGEAKNLIYRYLSSDRKTISSFLGTLGSTNGEFLTENISDISVSPDGTKFFYLSPSSTGITGSVRGFNDTKRSQIFTSSFTEWLSQWASNQIIFLTTKASYRELGYIYSLNTSSGAFNAVFGGVQGLTTLASPDGKILLYSSSTNLGPKLRLFKLGTRENIDLGLNGLPEKCIWGLNSENVYCGIPNYIEQTEPDSWYQGLTSFNDHIVKINVATGSNITIAESNIESIDATHMFLDDKEQTLFFINKKDSTLWSLDLR